MHCSKTMGCSRRRSTPRQGHAGVSADNRCLAIGQHLGFPARQRKDCAGRIAGEKKVAAAAKHQGESGPQLGPLQHIGQPRGVRQFNQPRRDGLHAKGVALTQGGVADDADGIGHARTLRGLGRGTTGGRLLAATDRIDALGHQGRAPVHQP